MAVSATVVYFGASACAHPSTKMVTARRTLLFQTPLSANPLQRQVPHQGTRSAHLPPAFLRSPLIDLHPLVFVLELNHGTGRSDLFTNTHRRWKTSHPACQTRPVKALVALQRPSLCERRTTATPPLPRKSKAMCISATRFSRTDYIKGGFSGPSARCLPEITARPWEFGLSVLRAASAR